MAGRPTSELRRRVLLYGGAATLIGSLGFFGFVYPSLMPPDAGTLLGIAQLHLGLAEVIPAKTKAGQALPFRAEHLAKAQEALDMTEQVAPGLAITSEFRAFKAWIEGDYPTCVRWYEEVLARSSGDAPMQNKTHVNLAQVRLASGQPQLAQQDLARVAAGDRDASWHLSAARVHAALGRTEQRTSALRAAAAAAKTKTDDVAMMKQVADAAFQWGDAIAASCYEGLPRKGPVEWYRLAKLKIERGEIDSGQNALRSARETGSAQLVKLVENDREFWTEQQARGLVSFDPVTGNATVAAPAK